MLQLTRRGSAPPGDSATRITGIALGPIFFAPRRGIVCLWTDIYYKWYPDATMIKQNARDTAGDNRVNCNRIPRATVYDIPPTPPGDSAGQKIALIATGLNASLQKHPGYVSGRVYCMFRFSFQHSIAFRTHESALNTLNVGSVNATDVAET